MSRARSHAAAALALVLSASCGGAGRAAEPPRHASPAPAPLWVLAPHPDDESLMAAHVIAEATRAGRPVFVQLATNGDLGCERDGWQRQREALAAVSVLGLDADHLRFLSYPDGALDALGAVPLPPRPRRLEDGSCGEGATTYARDVHSARTGAPGAYTAENALADLAALLERDRPSDVYVSHPIDDHPDHATTYVLLRRALERARLDALPRLHRAIVHAGGCWPNGSAEHEPCGPAGGSRGTPYPPLPGPLASYRPNERVVVADGGALARRAIAEHRSQLHADVDHDWLGDFARGESVYWSESLVRDPSRPERVVRAPAPGASSGVGEPPTSTRVEGDRTIRAIVHRAPFRLAFDASVPEGGAARVHFLASEVEDEAHGYAIAIHGDRDVEIRRSCDRSLRTVHIPDDGARHATHRWELRVDPRPDEGGIAELELRRDGQLLAVIVDPAPFLSGVRVITRERRGAAITSLAIEGERR